MHIPLLTHTVWPYIAFFPYIFLTPVILWQSNIFIQYIISIIFAGTIGTLIWYVFPNGVIRPELLNIQNISSKILYKIYQKDHDTNGFPSGHVFYTLVTTYFLAIHFPQMMYLLWIFALTIVISTITTKQHYVVDIIGGILVTIVSIWFSKSISPVI
jgi:membrane-associated phospholipid phosphatase